MAKQQYIHRHVGDSVNGAILLNKISNQKWEMRCAACGKTFIRQPSESNGLCPECNFEAARQRQIIHGESPDTKKKATRLYNIWNMMRTRCRNSHVDYYYAYGGRGISVCPEWDDYLTFKEWALSHGYNDSLSIDRINVNGNYEPDNCRWATQKEQMRNTRKNHLITYNGETKTLVEWSEETGIPYHTLKRRINNYGFSIEDALTLPVNKGNNQNLRKESESHDDK